MYSLTQKTVSVGPDPVGFDPTVRNQTRHRPTGLLGRFSSNVGWRPVRVLLAVLLLLSAAVANTLPAQAQTPDVTAPSAPQNLSATPGDGKVTLAWQAPADDGGADIVRYDIRYLLFGSSWVEITGDDSLTATVDGLVNGREYRFDVRAVNSAGRSGASSLIVNVRPRGVPSEPRNLSATPGSGAVKLDWQRPSDTGGIAVTGYQYRYAAGWDVPPGTAWHSVGHSQFALVSGLVNGWSYAFEVRARNRSGGGAAAEITAIPATVPSAPQNLTARLGHRSVILKWQAPADNGGFAVTRYEYRYARGASVPAATSWRSAGTDLTVTIWRLTAGTAHAFEVRAVNAKGDGAAAEVAATPQTIPSAPQNPTATPGDRSVMLAWQAPGYNGGAAVYGYEYRYARGARVPDGTRWRFAGTGLTKTVGGLANGTAYAFQVRAINAHGRGGPTGMIKATPATVPSAPQNLTAAPGGGKVTLAWQAPAENGGSAVTRYEYRYARGASVPAATVWQSAGADLNVTIGSLANGAAHAFQVRAVNGRGAGGAAAIAATPAAVASAPQNLTATPGDGAVTLAWQAPAEKDGFAVTGYEYRYAEGTAVPSATVWRSAGTDLTVTVAGLANGKVHAFQVRAVSGKDEGPEAKTTATPATVPSAPQNLTATPDDGTVTLAWQAPTENGGFAVTRYEYRHAEGSSVPAATVWQSAGTDLTVTIGGLANGAAHAFEVRAVNAKGAGGAAEIAATPANVPSAPQNLTATPGDSKVTLAWQAPAENGGSAVTGYEYRHAEGSSVPAATVWQSAGTDLTVTVDSLPNGAAHAFEVRAVNATGGGPAVPVHATPIADLVLTVEPVDKEVTEGEPVRYRIMMSRPTGWISVGYEYEYQGDFMFQEPVSAVGGMRSKGGQLYWERDETTVDDGKVEADGTYTVRLLAGDGYRLGTPSTATVRILDNDTPNRTHAEVSAHDTRVAEGPGAVLEFPVTLDRVLDTTVTVDWETADSGSHGAQPGLDYEADSGTLTFHPGETAKTVRIAVLEDNLDEGREQMVLFLWNASGADLSGDGSVAVGIIGDPGSMPSPAPTVPSPLTASFHGVPAEHDGESAFTVDFRLSEHPHTLRSYRTVRDSLFEVAGGRIANAQRAERGQNKDWVLTLEPSGLGNVTVSLIGTTDCATSPAVCTEDGRKLAGPLSLSVNGPVSFSVADAEVTEGADAALAFTVSLNRAQELATTVDYATSDGTARAGEDYVAAQDTLRFEPGETVKTVEVQVLEDAHDEARETMTLTLSRPSGAQLADATATGAIVNTDPMPNAWIARFGRTVADQVLDAVQGRMSAVRQPGAEVTLAGERIDLGSPFGAGNDRPSGNLPSTALSSGDAATGGTGGLAGWRPGGMDLARSGFDERTISGRDLLLGSSFSLTAETGDQGSVSLWGRSAATQFDGRADGVSLDGEVATGLLGVDWSGGPAMAGLLVGLSEGSGSYRGPEGDGTVTSTLTGLYPWGRYALTEHIELWGAAGYGEGTLALTPEGRDAIRADLDLWMAATGLRGTLVDGGADGLTLAAKTDATIVTTSTASARDLAASEATVTRLRAALEGSRPISLNETAELIPSFELGVRHDGGDAETGFGVDIGGGLAWSHPASGISADLRGRGLLSHESRGFRIRGISGSFAWDPDPASDRGASLALMQTMGASAAGGVNALFGRESLAGLAANDNDAALQNRRLELKLGYGFSALGDRFTSKPELGIGVGQGHRDYRLGWRFGMSQGGPAALEFVLEASRREHTGDSAGPEHGIAFKVNARW